MAKTTKLFKREPQNEAPVIEERASVLIPIAQHAPKPDDSGALIRLLLPMTGSIRKLVMHVGELSKEKTILRFALTGTDGVVTWNIEVKRGDNEKECEIAAHVGDRLVVMTTDPEVTVGDFWFSTYIKMR